MTPETARKFLQTYEGKRDVLSFVKPSHLEELSPLLECHIEAVTVCKGEFHELESGKTYMPRKETLDKFAGAAGVSYNEQAERTWKEGDTCYVGRSQAMVMGPDGKMIFGDVCEYEFDAEVRTEEMKLNGKSDYKDGRYTGKRDLTDKELASERIQFMKVGRQRANTGARNRATVSILGMSTGFKGLFGKDDPPTATRTFLFSRVIVNAKNELVMNRMLDNIGGNVAQLFGPQKQAALPPSREPDMKPAGSTTVGNDPALDDADIPLETEPAPAPQEDPELAAAAGALLQWLEAESTPSNMKAAIQSLMDRGENRKEILIGSLSLVKLLEKTRAKNLITLAAGVIADRNATRAAMDATKRSIDKALEAAAAGGTK